MKSGRVLLVPGAVGSPDFYYDFLLGYLFPLTLWVTDHPGTPVAVRRCGDLDAWFELLPPGTDIDTIAVSGVLRRVVRRSGRCLVLRPLDNPRTFRRTDLVWFAGRVRAVAGVPAVGQGSTVLVADRSGVGGAATRRSVPNMADVAIALTSAREERVDLLDSATMTPADQVAAHSAARVMVGQHGAGLVNMLWMPVGSTVVEILPPLNPQVRTIYRELAAVLGHSYVTVPQESAHAPVDAVAVVEALIHRPAPVPQTARVRVRREVYRAGKLAEERLRRVPVVGWPVRRLR